MNPVTLRAIGLMLMTGNPGQSPVLLQTTSPAAQPLVAPASESPTNEPTEPQPSTVSPTKDEETQPGTTASQEAPPDDNASDSEPRGVLPPVQTASATETAEGLQPRSALPPPGPPSGGAPPPPAPFIPDNLVTIGPLPGPSSFNRPPAPFGSIFLPGRLSTAEGCRLVRRAGLKHPLCRPTHGVRRR
jgi:hypothetical protein